MTFDGARGFSRARRSWTLVSRALASLLLGVNASDPVSFAGASLLLAASAFVGSYLPARRASRLDPLIAFRQP